MLQKAKFHEGVPVGAAEFTEFFGSVRKHLDSLLTYALSSNINNGGAGSNGGFIVGNELEIVKLNGFWVLRAVSNLKKGLLFAKETNSSRYFVEEYSFVPSPDKLPVEAWQVLATGYDKSRPNELLYGKALLPKFPIYWNANAASLLTDDFYEVRYNGVPQPKDLSYTYRPDDGLSLTSIKLGAEYPHPVDNNGNFVPLSSPLSFAKWVQHAGNAESIVTLKFPFANFGSETPIVLLREAAQNANGDTYYKYHALREDRTVDPTTIAINSFKVVDRSRGIVRVKLTEQFVKYALRSETQTPLFNIIVPEQLTSYINNGVTEYKSRYGSVYSGDPKKVELVSLSFKGEELILKSVVDDISTAQNTDTIYVDRIKAVGDLLLAVEYYATPRVELASQRNKFFPDVITAFYSVGIPENRAASKHDIRAYIETNKSSWYNQNVAIGEYRPVSRMDRGVVGLCTPQMAQSIGITPSELIDPDQSLSLASNAGLPAYNYSHVSKVKVGIVDKYARVDATIPEPHYVNPTIVKMTLPEDESLHIFADTQMSIHRRYTIEGRLIVDGFLIVE